MERRGRDEVGGGAGDSGALVGEGARIAAALWRSVRVGRAVARGGGVVAAVRGGGALAQRGGAGEDFFDYRVLGAGEAAAGVDWRALARTDRAIVRRRQALASERWLVVVDGSASMAWGGPGDAMTKRRWALGAGLGVAMHGWARGERVMVAVVGAGELVVVGGGGGLGGAGAVGRLGAALGAVDGRSGGGSFVEGVGSLVERWGRGGVGWAGRCDRVLVVGDGLDEVGALGGALAGLRDRVCGGGGWGGWGGVSMVRVLSAGELEAWRLGVGVGRVVRDPEGGSGGRGVVVGRDWSGYRGALMAHCAAVDRVVGSLGGIGIGARSDEPAVGALRRWLVFSDAVR